MLQQNKRDDARLFIKLESSLLFCADAQTAKYKTANSRTLISTFGLATKSYLVLSQPCISIATALKKILAIFLSVIILSHVFVNVGLGIYYHLNKAYIIQKLCENRSNPKLHCNGHCYLSKQLKKAEEGEQKQSKNILKEKEETISNKTETVSAVYFPTFSHTAFKPYLFSFLVSYYRNDLVKPPTV